MSEPAEPKKENKNKQKMNFKLSYTIYYQF